jgi:lipopolysaccharide transport system permease protein
VVPKRLHLVFMLNPLSGLLEAFRVSLLGTSPMPWGFICYSAVVSIGVLVAGAISFRRMERSFADVI